MSAPRSIPGGGYTLEDVVFTVERLTCPNTGCPWNKEKSSEDYIRFVCEESQEALQEIAVLAELDTGAEDPALRRALESELGDVLYVALVAIAKAAQKFGFDPLEPYHSAVLKIRGRTPYMSEWGDGSLVNSLSEAHEIWKSRKAEQKATSSVEGLPPTFPPSRSSQQDLVFTVLRLTAAEGGCPWTASQTTENLLRFLCSECHESLHEFERLSKTDENSEMRCEVLQLLISELGDVLFDVLMAIFLASRDYGLEPSNIYGSSVEKIRGRTPYISAWGDGTVAKSGAEAQAIWNVRKAMQKEAAYQG
ncbi:hypothetical protein CYMTET_7273 [Cymbomonas tetramitiformis]|uniref:NTP pyrophosphohydrolase MazG-like domain-containing protein n=1 Tax=Cymbomonas tetramitiformis TaxID=36881 RepID=A0AAE0LH86_9CHLO|nr:hypothetical protein CYMTET_7273 [Cymbomonas tetramitiformis]|eukprot:gene20615-24715_t